MADTETTDQAAAATEPEDETTEDATAGADEDAPEDERSAEDWQADADGLRAILSHLVPDLDVDAALDDIAVKRDGTIVYTGAAPQAEAAAPAKATRTVDPPRKAPKRQPRQKAAAGVDAKSNGRATLSERASRFRKDGW